MENSSRKIWGLEDLVLGIIECQDDKKGCYIGNWEDWAKEYKYCKIISLDIEVQKRSTDKKDNFK